MSELVRGFFIAQSQRAVLECRLQLCIRMRGLYQALIWCIEFVSLLGLWFLLTGKVNFAELIAGALTTLVALFAVHLCTHESVRESLSRFSQGSRSIFQAWRIPFNIFSGLFQAFYALVQQIFTREGARSKIESIPFELADADDPESKIRRTLAITYPSCSPNFVAIDIDRKKRQYIFHQVYPTSPSRMLVNLCSPQSAQKGRST